MQYGKIALFEFQRTIGLPKPLRLRKRCASDPRRSRKNLIKLTESERITEFHIPRFLLGFQTLLRSLTVNGPFPWF